MKAMILALCVVSNGTSAAQSIAFEYLNANHASVEVQAAMTDFAREHIAECEAWRNELVPKWPTFFKAKKVRLERGSRRAYLVMPGDSCHSSFHGAHSTAFWILVRDSHGTLQCVLNSKRDGIELLDTYTKGFRDLELLYGFEREIFRYSGTEYLGSGNVTFSKP
jgi:hypothetical protein